MAIIPPQRKSISMVKAQLLNPATTSHFQVSVSFQDQRFNRYKQEIGLNLDQGRLNILCSDAALPGSSFATAEITNNIPGVRERIQSIPTRVRIKFRSRQIKYIMF